MDSTRGNVNLGILGHVDSGKTTLCRVLSSTFSTASNDKGRQSKERGITLDLGFSSFTDAGVNYTLVDHPGHSTLIRTVLLGSRIIDALVLVVDAVSGVQPQTIEALAISSTLPHVSSAIVVVNKIDAISQGTEGPRYKNVVKSILDASKGTPFSGAKILPFSAMLNDTGQEIGDAQGLSTEQILHEITASTPIPDRSPHLARPFLFAVDHCFPLKGVGSVLTGTCTSGSLEVNSSIHLPAFDITRKVKSIQKFRSSSKSVAAGDRAAICVTQIDSASIERAVAVEPGSIIQIKECVAKVTRIPLFSGALADMKNGKYHITLGSETVLADVEFFGAAELAKDDKTDCFGSFVVQQKYIDNPNSSSSEEDEKLCCANYVRITFPSPLFSLPNPPLMGLRLDRADYSCRIAFHGPVLHHTDGKTSPSCKSRITSYTSKEKTCTIDKVGALFLRESDKKECAFECVAKNLFGGSNMSTFTGLKLESQGGNVGVIARPFGTEGKFIVDFPAGLDDVKAGDSLIFRFRKVKGDKSGKMIQDFINVPKSVNRRAIANEPPPPPKKVKSGTVEKEKGDGLFIVTGLFKPEDDIKKSLGNQVTATVSSGDILEGKIAGSFGKAGKCKVQFDSTVVLQTGTKVNLTVA